MFGEKFHEILRKIRIRKSLFGVLEMEIIHSISERNRVNYLKYFATLKIVRPLCGRRQGATHIA